MADQIIRALCTSGGIRVLACTAKGLAEEISSLQGASLTARIALGRGLVSGALMGALLKDDQRIALKFEGNGPLRKMIIEADFGGAVRGSLANPEAEIEPVNNRWNVAGLIGKAGFLTVSKDIGIGGAPYQGTVQLQTSEIGDDLAYYLTDSEQTPTAIGLGVSLDENGVIAECGGFLVQALPGANPDEIDTIMNNIAELAPLATILASSGPMGAIQSLFGDIPYTLLESHEIFFRCGCNLEKVERALLTLGKDELLEIQANGATTQVNCEFCRKAYHVAASELDELIRRLNDSQN